MRDVEDDDDDDEEDDDIEFESLAVYYDDKVFLLA